MKHKKKIIIFALILAVVVTIFLLNNNPNEKAPTTSEKTLEPEKIAKVLVIGENVRFKSTDKVTYSFSSLKEAEKNSSFDARFILLRDNEKVDSSVLQKWVEDKKVILFYGTQVSPSESKEKIGIDFDVESSEFHSTVDLYYHLFGYGYSLSHKANLKWELQGNDAVNLEEKITAFIGKYGTTN